MENKSVSSNFIALDIKRFKWNKEDKFLFAALSDMPELQELLDSKPNMYPLVQTENDLFIVGRTGAYKFKFSSSDIFQRAEVSATFPPSKI